MERGFVFSFDALIALFVLFVMIFLMLAQAKVLVEGEVDSVREFELKSAGLFYLDSLVKNFDENAVRGVAKFDVEKRRVESNVLDYSLLKRIDVRGFEFVKGIELEFLSGGREEVFRGSGGEECFVFERFVLVKGEKGKVKVKVCT